MALHNNQIFIKTRTGSELECLEDFNPEIKFLLYRGFKICLTWEKMHYILNQKINFTILKLTM